MNTYFPFTPSDACSNHDTYESIFIRLPQPNGTFSVKGAIYRPPGGDLKLFNDQWNCLVTILNKKNKDIYLIGDFNMNLLKSDDHRDTEIFYETSSANHFLPTVSRPTRITKIR